jgi:3-methyladenine DNA glycosylase Mpg
MVMARFLIGKILVRDHLEGSTSDRIVETEASQDVCLSSATSRYIFSKPYG